MKPNDARYHVWEMGIRKRTEPVRHVNRQPLDLAAAKQLARIGAQEGKHDRAVTTSPKSREFRVLAQYEAKTGENVTGFLYRGEKRRVKQNPVAAIAVAVVEEEPAVEACDDIE
jgi:hypothetical protein